MGDLSMEEARCSMAREMLTCQGHSHLRCPAAKHSSDIPARDVDQASLRRSVSVADISVTEQASLNRVPPLVPPLVQPLLSLLAEPTTHSLTGIASISRQQLDTSHQSRRDLVRRALSPAEQERSKKARTPSTEED